MKRIAVLILFMIFVTLFAFAGCVTNQATGEGKAAIIATYNFGDIQAEVGYDAEFNIYVNFNPDILDNRIIVKQANKGAIEWLTYADDDDELINLHMRPIRSSDGGNTYYWLHFLYVGAPYSSNEIYIFDAEQGALVDKLHETTTTSAMLTKMNDGYHIYIPEIGIGQDISFSPHGDRWLIDSLDEDERDEFIVEITLLLRNIDEISFTDNTITAKWVVFVAEDDEDNPRWIPDFYIGIIYEILNHRALPMETYFIH